MLPLSALARISLRGQESIANQMARRANLLAQYGTPHPGSDYNYS
jgi:hypothetical protein